MDRADVFPITLGCNDKGWSAYEFRAYFRRAKPEEMVWYGYDTIICGRTEVEFVAYNMRDSCYGGIGEEIGRFKATVPAEITQESVDKRILQVAALRRANELDAMEAAIIEGYADEIRAALGGVK